METSMVPALMRRCRNHFVESFADGAWSLADGKITGPVPMTPGWIAVGGSGLCDGVHLVGDDGTIAGLTGQGSWTGRVWHLAPPEDFLHLAGEIAAYRAGHSSAEPQVVRRRESFGVYACEVAYGEGEAASTDWEAAFADALRPFRRMFDDLEREDAGC